MGQVQDDFGLAGATGTGFALFSFVAAVVPICCSPTVVVHALAHATAMDETASKELDEAVAGQMESGGGEIYDPPKRIRQTVWPVVAKPGAGLLVCGREHYLDL